MSASPEKVHALIDQLAGEAPEQLRKLLAGASGMQALALGAVAPFLPNMIPAAVDQLRAAVPDDADQLDHLLEGAAAAVLALKSDPPAIDTTAEPDAAHPLHAGPDGSGETVGFIPGTFDPDQADDDAEQAA